MTRGRLRRRSRVGDPGRCGASSCSSGRAGVRPQQLERSEPPNGGMVAAEVTLTLWFAEPISARPARFDLRTLDGGRGRRDRLGVRGRTARGSLSSTTTPLVEATYGLDWSVVSPTTAIPRAARWCSASGCARSWFRPRKRSSRKRPDSSSAGSTSPRSCWRSARWRSPAGCSDRWARPATARSAGRGTSERWPRPPRWSSGSHPVRRAPQAGSSLGAWLDATWVTLTGTPWGHLWLAREAALVVVAVALWSWATAPATDPADVGAPGRRARHRRRGRARVAGRATPPLSRADPASAPSPRPCHLVAAGVWAGGLAVLALCLIPVMRRDPDARGRSSPPRGAPSARWPRSRPSSCWRRASTSRAATSPTSTRSSSTLYGGAVAAKVILVAVALTLAGLNTLLVNPRLAAPVGRILASTGRVGAGLAPPLHHRRGGRGSVLIVAVARPPCSPRFRPRREVGMVATEPPPRGPRTSTASSSPSRRSPPATDQIRLIVRARSTVKPEPAPIDGVDVLLVGPAGTPSTCRSSPSSRAATRRRRRAGSRRLARLGRRAPRRPPGRRHAGRLDRRRCGSRKAPARSRSRPRHSAPPSSSRSPPS